MTCWLTGHDDRFGPAVAGGVVSDLASDVRHQRRRRLMGRYELGGAPWDDAERVRRDVADHPRRPR